MSDPVDDEHRWRQTSKVFALVCSDCGMPYHTWLLTEVDRLKSEIDRLKAGASPVAQSEVVRDDQRERDIAAELAQVRASCQQEIDQLRAATQQLSEANATLTQEIQRLQVALDEARGKLAIQAKEVSAPAGA